MGERRGYIAQQLNRVVASTTSKSTVVLDDPVHCWVDIGSFGTHFFNNIAVGPTQVSFFAYIISLVLALLLVPDYPVLKTSLREPF